MKFLLKELHNSTVIILDDTLQQILKTGIGKIKYFFIYKSIFASNSIANCFTVFLFNKEFKISGMLGKGDKNQLSYSNLLCQVSEGRNKGFDDSEISVAIRKSVQPSTHLRTYLDSKIDLPLDKMLSFIRSYLKEKNATELFQELNNCCQQEDEDSLNFLFKSMQLREKIIMASGLGDR